MESNRSARKNSRWMWLLLTGFAILSLSGWTRLIGAFLNWYWLNLAGVIPGPMYLAVTGGFWGLAGLVGLAWVGLRWHNYRLAGCLVALFYAGTYWADRLWVYQTGEDGQNTALVALITGVGLLYTLLVLRPFQGFHLRKEEPNAEIRTGN